jgi:hypothetical protein
LAGQNKERLGQRASLSKQGHGVFLHRLEHGGLRLGRCAVDLVRKEDVGEYRAGLEGKFAFAGGGFLENVRSEHISGHQVGRELDALEVQLEDFTDRFDQGGLAEPRQTFEQHVALAQNADEHHSVKILSAKQNPVELLKDTAGKVGRRFEFFWFENGNWIAHLFGLAGALLFLPLEEAFNRFLVLRQDRPRIGSSTAACPRGQRAMRQFCLLGACFGRRAADSNQLRVG